LKLNAGFLFACESSKVRLRVGSFRRLNLNRCYFNADVIGILQRGLTRSFSLGVHLTNGIHHDIRQWLTIVVTNLAGDPRLELIGTANPSTRALRAASDRHLAHPACVAHTPR